MRSSIQLLALLLLAACTASKSQYSAGHIGCPEAEITIVSETGGWMANSWVAECRGKTFHCVYMTGGRVSCTQEIPKAN
jgi:hypothetical protein